MSTPELPEGWWLTKSLTIHQLVQPDGIVVREGMGTKAYESEAAAIRHARRLRLQYMTRKVMGKMNEEKTPEGGLS